MNKIGKISTQSPSTSFSHPNPRNAAVCPSLRPQMWHLFAVPVSLVFLLKDRAPRLAHKLTTCPQQQKTFSTSSHQAWRLEQDFLPPDVEDTRLCHQQFFSSSLSFLQLSFPSVLSGTRSPQLGLCLFALLLGMRVSGTGLVSSVLNLWSPLIQWKEHWTENQTNAGSNGHLWLCELQQVA